MLLGSASLTMLAIGIWIAYHAEQAVDRGDTVSGLQTWAGGLLIIGGLAAIGIGLEWTLHPISFVSPWRQ
jgi:hypothetical protein